MTKLTRTALAAVAAIGVIAAVGVVGVASASAAETAKTRSLESAQLRDRGLSTAAGGRAVVRKLNAQIARLSTSNRPRLPLVPGATIADVKVAGTSMGGPLHGKFCQNVADQINEKIGEGYKELFGGNMAGARDNFAAAVRMIEEHEGPEYGCKFE
jgi:hypothetical protein